jgi:hypothetical protein
MINLEGKGLMFNFFGLLSPSSNRSGGRSSTMLQRGKFVKNVISIPAIGCMTMLLNGTAFGLDKNDDLTNLGPDAYDLVIVLSGKETVKMEDKYHFDGYETGSRKGKFSSFSSGPEGSDTKLHWQKFDDGTDKIIQKDQTIHVGWTTEDHNHQVLDMYWTDESGEKIFGSIIYNVTTKWTYTVRDTPAPSRQEAAKLCMTWNNPYNVPISIVDPRYAIIPSTELPEPLLLEELNAENPFLANAFDANSVGTFSIPSKGNEEMCVMTSNTVQRGVVKYGVTGEGSAAKVISFVQSEQLELQGVDTTPPPLKAVNEIFFINELNKFVGTGGEILLNLVLSEDDPTTPGFDPDGVLADPDLDGPISKHIIQRLDVGDRLVGIGTSQTVECVSCPRLESRALGLDVYEAKNALRAFKVIEKVAVAGGGFNFTFGPLSPEEYSATIKTASGGSVTIPAETIPVGTMILSFNDPTPNFTVANIPGSPGMNWVKATEGTRHWSVGVADPTDFWVSSFASDDLGLLPFLSSKTTIGKINFGLSLLSGSTGLSSLNKVPCAGPAGIIVNKDFCLSGSAVGTFGIDTPFQIGLRTEITFNPVNGGGTGGGGTGVPTLSEWGLILLTLLLLTGGVLFIMRQPATMSAMGGGSLHSEGGNPLPFVPAVFIKALTITGLLVLLGFAVAFWLSSPPSTTDIVGISISAPIFAYLLHLVMLLKR